jgi:hypothetical protein
MPRFKVGDRVQLAGDIARFYACLVGVIADTEKDPSSALAQYEVRLADETVATFFDFQLQSPPVVRAQIMFDTLGRDIHIVASGVEIRLKISDTPNRSLTGQVTLAKAAACKALVSLLIDGTAIDTKPTNASGAFEFHEAPAGDVALEAVVPGKRIVALLNT